MKKLLLASLLITGLISCRKETQYPAYKVLILGNSITYAPANPSIGWNNNWGMAATAADKDYVHILTARFKEVNQSSTVDVQNIFAFEADFDTYNFDNLKSVRDAKPDMIILRIGENVTRVADSTLFKQKYTELLTYLKTNNPNVKILAVGSIWSHREMANSVMSKYSPYISLNSLESEPSILSFGLYTDPSLQAQPSDKGMEAIADRIWAELAKVLQIA